MNVFVNTIVLSCYVKSRSWSSCAFDI